MVQGSGLSLSSLNLYQYCNLWVKLSLVLEWPKNKCSLISMVQKQEPLRTSIHAQRQRLQRRLCLGFLLLEQRFMVGESCRESLRLNYTDGEHQIQEKLPRLWGEWWGWDELGIQRERYWSGVWERHITPDQAPSAPLHLSSNTPPSKSKVATQIIWM